MEKVKGFTKLTEKQRNILIATYEKHMKAFGTDTRKKYTVENIKEVKPVQEKVIKIYFKNGDWWHYNGALEWY